MSTIDYTTEIQRLEQTLYYSISENRNNPVADIENQILQLRIAQSQEKAVNNNSALLKDLVTLGKQNNELLHNLIETINSNTDELNNLRRLIARARVNE